MSRMCIIGVLDLMGGVAVHAIGGRRSEYRPICSPLCPSAHPLDVARAYRRDYGIDELYLADLDAIGGSRPDWGCYESLMREDFRLWVDAGVRDADGGSELAKAGVGVVVGLETVRGIAEVESLAQRLGENMVFSLDLRDGVPLSIWEEATPFSIAARAIERGVSKILVLDLARVGGGAGIGTDELCTRLGDAGVEVWAGGGVRDGGDLARLRASGVSAALVATALHHRWVTREECCG